jgi:thioredoxin-related protein
MSRLLTTTAVLVLVTTAGAALADDLTWAGTYDQALAQAKASDRLVLLVLQSELCPWCTKLEQETLTAASVTTQGNQFVAVKVSVGEDRELGSTYAKNGVPQTVFLTPDGQLVGKLAGFVPAPVFAAQMHDAWAAREFPREIAGLEQAIADRPRDARALARLGHLYVATDQEAKAEPLLKRAIEQIADLDRPTAAGARLDLLIARLPADDGETAPDFTKWLADNPEHARLVEGEYYAGYALALKGEGQACLGLWAKVVAAASETSYAVLADYYSGVVRQALESRQGNGSG